MRLHRNRLGAFASPLLLLPSLLLAFALAFAPSHAGTGPRFPYGSPGSPVRGVNLGGWLVLEPFVTPGLFNSSGSTKVIDEWTYGQLAYGGNRTKAAQVLRNHHATFYTEADFAQMAEYGLNHVRIPIGYWAFGTSHKEPYLVLDQFAWLKKACLWAGKHGIKVMIDLHGARGSQNGFDHSGRKGSVGWQYDASARADTLAVIKTMIYEFSKPVYNKSVASIAVLNEAWAELKTVEAWYRQAYKTIRGRSSTISVSFGDGFAGADYWRGKFPASSYKHVMLEAHVYSVFQDEMIMWNMTQRMQYICDFKPVWQKSAQNGLPVLLGEASSAVTDCAPWLNGRGVGSRYGGTMKGTKAYRGSCASKTLPASQLSASYKQLLARNWQLQREVAEAGAGWIYWAWKVDTEHAPDWDYRRGVQYGWIGKDPSARLVNDTCAQYT